MVLKVPDQIKEVIRKWYSLSSSGGTGEVDTNDIYFRFMALWVSFNALYDLEYVRRYGPAGRGREFRGVKVFSEGGERENIHESLLREDDKYRESVDCLKKKYGRKVLELGCKTVSDSS